MARKAKGRRWITIIETLSAMAADDYKRFHERRGDTARVVKCNRKICVQLLRRR